MLKLRRNVCIFREETDNLYCFIYENIVPASTDVGWSIELFKEFNFSFCLYTLIKVIACHFGLKIVVGFVFCQPFEGTQRRAMIFIKELRFYS